MKAATAKGHTLKHSRAKKTKHSATTKHHPVHHAKSAVKHAHHVTAKATHATHAKAKGLALNLGDVACCTTEALGASLRLGGLAVTDAQVLDLFRLAGGDEDAGMPVGVALEAAAEFGLGGCRLASWEMAGQDSNLQPPISGGYALGPLRLPHGALSVALPAIPSLILGVELPGPHTVLATPDGWWWWGELWCPCEFPDAVIEEAWAVEWAVAA